MVGSTQFIVSKTCPNICGHQCVCQWPRTTVWPVASSWWRHEMEIFPRYWPFVRVKWRRALMFSLICAWTNGWVNNREAGDLRRRRAHYNVTVMVRQSILELLSWYPVTLLNFCKPCEERSSNELKWFDSKIVHRDSGPNNGRQGVRTNASKIDNRWFASWQPQHLIMSRIKWHHDSVMKARMPRSIYKCNLV